MDPGARGRPADPVTGVATATDRCGPRGPRGGGRPAPPPAAATPGRRGGTISTADAPTRDEPDGPCPAPRPVPAAEVRALARLVRRGPVAVLTGAGCSTESGIPDYRGPGTERDEHDPIRYREFVEDAGARARYWARSAVGWARIRDAEPNAAHRALARLEAGGPVLGVITQNVDGLHQAAGSRRVLELHGSLDRVRCLECGAREARSSVQRRLLAMNPGFRDRGDRGADAGRAEIAPDGDARVDDSVARDLAVPGCRRCGGVLKPDVVFFGESVPTERVDRAWALLDQARTLLVAGSSLSVYSGYRFVRRADEQGKPVGIVNLTATRGDGEARMRVAGRVGDVLPRLAGAVASPGDAA